jgi:hypothetical protein
MQSQVRSLFWILLPFLWYAWMRMGSLSQPTPCTVHARAPAAAVALAPSGGGGASWSVSAPQLAPLDRDGAGFGEPPPSALAVPPVPQQPPPGPPRAPGFPLPPIPALSRWGDGAAAVALAPLRGTCWTLRPQAPKAKDAAPDDFLYEVCFGDRIKQVQHPILGRAVLGVFDGWGGEGRLVQLYKSGSVCEGWGNREVQVEVLCDKRADAAPVLWDVKEPDVCKYAMEVRSAHAC